MNRSLHACLTAALLLLATRQAAAQDIDIVTQDVHIDLTGSDLRVEVSMDFRATLRTSEVWILEPLVPIAEARFGGTEVAVSPHPTYPGQVRVVELGTTLEADEPGTLRLVLEGQPACRVVAGYDACAYEEGLAVLLPGSPGYAWYVSNLLVEDAFDGSVSVRAPAGMEVVAGLGAPSGIDPQADGSTLWTYEYATVSDSLFLYAREAEVLEQEAGETPLKMYYPASASTEEVERLRRTTAVTADVLPVYEDLFGALALDEIHLMIVPSRFAFGGMSLLGNIFFGDFLLREDFEYLIEQGTAHEVAHFFWGNTLVPRLREESPVLSEALAEYSAWLALGELRGEAARTSGCRMNSTWYMYGRPSDEDVGAIDPAVERSAAFIHITYHKGAQVWRTLAEAVGEDPFLDTLAELVTRSRAGTFSISVAELTEVLRARTGYDATTDVDQWLRRPGFPKLTATTTRGDGLVCLDIELEGDFALHLPIGVRSADGTLEETVVSVRAGANQACIEAPSSLAAVEVDPRWTMTREVKAGLEGDVTLDGYLDAADLIEIALHKGTRMPSERRTDGGYDPLYDLDGNRVVDGADLSLAASRTVMP